MEGVVWEELVRLAREFTALRTSVSKEEQREVDQTFGCLVRGESKEVVELARRATAEKERQLRERGSLPDEEPPGVWLG
jgi:hypothetical protein